MDSKILALFKFATYISIDKTDKERREQENWIKKYI